MRYARITTPEQGPDRIAKHLPENYTVMINFIHDTVIHGDDEGEQTLEQVIADLKVKDVFGEVIDAKALGKLFERDDVDKLPRPPKVEDEMLVVVETVVA